MLILQLQKTAFHYLGRHIIPVYPYDVLFCTDNIQHNLNNFINSLPFCPWNKVILKLFPYKRKIFFPLAAFNPINPIAFIFLDMND